MPPPQRSRALRKDAFAAAFNSVKPVAYAITHVRSQQPPISSITWSPTGSMVATCANGHIRVWIPEKPNVKSSIEIRNAHPQDGVPNPGEVIEKIAFCPVTDSLLASAGHDGFLRLWDVRVGGSGPSAVCEYHAGDQTQCLSWHPHGTQLLVGRRDSAIHIVDIRRFASSSEPAALQYSAFGLDRSPQGRATLNGMAFSTSGQEVFATTQRGDVKILDFPSMASLHTLSGHMAPAYAVQYAPTASYVAVGSADSLISLWDTTSWLCTHTIRHQCSSVRDLSFSFDGMYIVAGGGTDVKDANNGLDIYHTDTGDCVHTINTARPVTQVAWHPSRYWIAYVGEANGMHIAGAGTHL